MSNTSSVPVADFRDFYKWKETSRYKEIVNGKDSVLSGMSPTSSDKSASDWKRQNND